MDSGKDPTAFEYELTDVEIQQLKEHNQKRVKKVVAFVGMFLTLLSLGLVAFSLALGSKIDMLVEETMKHQSTLLSITASVNSSVTS